MATLEINKKKWNEVQSFIEDDELYEDEEGFGREMDPHITILYGLHDEEIDEKELKDVIEVWESFEVELKTVGLFEQEKYDVVKFSITSKILNKYNKELREFPYTNDFPDYKAHATIAYVKPGKGKEIAKRYKDFEGMELSCTRMEYSKSDETRKFFKLKKDEKNN